MARKTTARCVSRVAISTSPGCRRAARRLVTLAVIAIALPGSADAQFGRLKQLKNAIRPDSATRAAAATVAAAKDSLARAAGAAGVVPVDTPTIGGSRLARAASAAKRASTKFEQVTGVSATDAALAASGLGAPGVIAKRLGVSPAGGAAAVLTGAAAKRAATAAATAHAGAAAPLNTVSGMAGMLDLGKMNIPSAAAIQNGAMNPGAITGGAMLGLTAADAQAMVTFQQEMMRVAMAASAGDVAAQARLEAWQATVVNHQVEIERLTLAASQGDISAMRKLQLLQFEMTRAWADPTLRATRAKGNPAVKP